MGSETLHSTFYAMKKAVTHKDIKLGSQSICTILCYFLFQYLGRIVRSNGAADGGRSY